MALVALLTQLKESTTEAHPKVLTHLGGGLVAGGLYHLKKEAPLSKKCQHYGCKSRRLMSSISETTVALGLGQYSAQLILNGDSINAVVDTEVVSHSWHAQVHRSKTLLPLSLFMTLPAPLHHSPLCLKTAPHALPCALTLMNATHTQLSREHASIYINMEVAMPWKDGPTLPT